MKYKATIFLLSFLVLGTARSQNLKMCGYQGYQTVEAVESACELQGAESTSTNAESAEKKVDAILDKVGLFRNFFVEECKDINNALAVTMPLDGGAIDRYILYDQSFFDKVSSSTGTDWGNTSILAHEVGHHLNGHTLSGSGSTHKAELQADEFSGFVLARMGCPLAEAQSAVSNLLPDEASATHPAKQDRMDAIAKGWSRGSGKKIEVKKIIKEVIENKVIVVNKDQITAEMVLANYLEAIGGQEKVIGVKTMTQKKKMINPLSPVEMIQNTIYLTPQKFAFQNFNEGKLSATTIFKNGTNYSNAIINGKKTWIEPVRLQSDLTEVSYFPEYSNLVNPQDLSYKGIETLKGVKCHAVALNELNMDMVVQGMDVSSKIEFTNYYNIDTGLLFATKTISTMTSNDESLKDIFGGKPTEAINYFSDYRDVSGILIPFKQMSENQAGEFVMETLSVEINPIIDSSIFETPKD